MEFSSQNTGVDRLSLLQGIFPTQGWNPGLPHCRQILYQLSHQENPRIQEWIDYPFSRGSSRPRNQTWVSWTSGRFFTNWAIGEARHRIMPMIVKHFIHAQRSKKSRKHYKWSYESGQGTRASCLLLMSSSFHPGVSVISPLSIVWRWFWGQPSSLKASPMHGAFCEWKLIQELIPISFTVHELVKSTW